MSEYYESGVIAIPKVTGNIVITIETALSDLGYTNLIPTSVTPGTTEIYNGVGYRQQTRWSSTGSISTSETVGQNGSAFFTTGEISGIAVGKKIRFVNCWMVAAYVDGLNYGAENCWYFNGSTPSSNMINGNSLVNGTWQQHHTVSDVIYSAEGVVTGFTFGANFHNVDSLTFTLVSKDPSKAIMYFEEDGLAQ